MGFERSGSCSEVEGFLKGLMSRERCEVVENEAEGIQWVEGLR